MDETYYYRRSDAGTRLGHEGHLVLRDLLVKMHTGHRKFIKTEFLAMLDESDLLANPEFWQSDNEDGARIYSGKANWPDLAKRLIRDIEDGVAA